MVQRWDATLNIKGVEFGENKDEEDCLSTRWKYAIKRGVPIRYYRIIIGVIFNKNFKGANLMYEKAKAEMKVNEIVTFFGHEGPEAREVVFGPFLN